jgi:hypothetical protein
VFNQQVGSTNGVKFENSAVQTRLDGSGNRNMIFAQ